MMGVFSTNIKLSQVSSDMPLCCSTPKRNQFLTVKESSQGKERKELSQGKEQEELSQGQEKEELSQGQEQELSQGQEQKEFSHGQEPEQRQDRPSESGKAKVALGHVMNTPLFKEITALCQVQI